MLSKWESIPLPSPTIATKLSFVHLTGTNYIAPGKNAVGKSSLSTPPTLILEMPTDLSGAPQSRGILCVTRLSPVVCLLAFLYPYFADRNSIMLPRRFRASTGGERACSGCPSSTCSQCIFMQNLPHCQLHLKLSARNFSRISGTANH